jgi:hypothetical protein
MARIRTIKPEFFTSEDIVSLSPYARLLYIALWCEADRDGRMSWRPATFKLRYFPGDKMDISSYCGELTRRGLVVLYGNGHAYIPSFSSHQHVNPREAASSLPVPDEPPRVTDASARVNDAQVGREGREGKGKEGVEDASRRDPPQRSRGSRLLPGWQPSDLLKAWASKERPDLDIALTVERFRDYWVSAAGPKGVKLDWEATFRNWVRAERVGAQRGSHDYAAVQRQIEEEERARAKH